jgi:hypothetical protein
MNGSLLPFIECDDSVGAVFCADAAMDTNHRLVYFIVPKNGIDNARIPAITAADAFAFIKLNPASFTGSECIGGTDLHARGVLTGPANHYDESSFHAACRFNTYTCFGQARFVLSQ